MRALYERLKTLLFGVLFIVLFAYPTMGALAQDIQQAPSASTLDRFVFRTNAAEWLLTIPNFQVGFDISGSQYNHDVALLGLKWNWNTRHTLVPFYVFNVFDLRPEWRHYFRQTQRESQRVKREDGTEYTEWEKTGFLSPKRKNPKPWQAWYYGLYADYTTYAFKPGETGRQGWAVGIGVSTGVELPLYEYKRGAVDMELGLSAGIIATANKAFRSGADLFAYEPVPARDNKFLVLPMLTEVRVAFAWRNKGISGKYDKVDPSLEIYSQAKSTIDSDAQLSGKASFDESKGEREMQRYHQSDSLYRADFKQSLEETKTSRLRNIESESGLSDKQKAKLKKYLDRRFNALLREFEAALSTEHRRAAQAQAEKERAQRQAQAEKERAAREAEKAKQKEAAQ